MRHPRRKGRKMDRARKRWSKNYKKSRPLPPCEWCGSTFHGHYPGCPDLEAI